MKCSHWQPCRATYKLCKCLSVSWPHASRFFHTVLAPTADNEPIGGPWPPTPQNNGTRFGDNALNDGQFFWDFRNTDAQDYWAEKVCLEGAADSSVDGMFTDDPGGYGAEHPAVQSAVQLSGEEIASLQAGTQKSWIKALGLLTKAKKYIPQAYRLTKPFSFNTTGAVRSEWFRF